MPTYGYRCGSCGHEFEIRQRMTDEPLKTCPKCKGKLAKMLYPVGISFKGSGFYTTDYKGSGQSAEASSNGVAPSSEGKSESKPEAKSDSKSETKSDTKSGSESRSKSESKSESRSKSESKSGSDKKGS
ncbi:MAG: FmdB family transcriptional regulator [Candidatus Dormibacteraeota bacterium]|nr:FmdB family transcriptional regulator [Candidatus Dormibacteraeota bacterium]